MPAPDTLNARIALAKGWTVERERALDLRGQPIVWKGQEAYKDYWHDSDGQYKGHESPDWVSMPKGVAELMAELNDHAKADNEYWVWGQNARHLINGPRNGYYCAKHGLYDNAMYLKSFCSDKNHPGDCIGDAWLSVFGKESDE